jgi:hypothetical protein
MQQLIRITFSDGDLLHPIRDDIPLAVLQYAEDTLILVRANTHATTRLEQTLDDFSLATALQISFDKTTFIPMNVPDDLASLLSTFLGTYIHSFP